MTMTSGNPSATLLLVTGLLSVSMAALGYYYLQMNSKKIRALTNDSNEAGRDNGQKTSTSTSMMEEEKIATVKSTATDMLETGAGTSSSSKSIAATVSETIEKTVASIEMPMMPRASLKKSPEIPKTNVEKVVEPPVKVVESSLVTEALTEGTLSPRKASKTNVKKVVEAPSEVMESPHVVALSEITSSPKKASKTKVEKVVEAPSEVMESLHVVTLSEVTSSPKTASKTNVEKVVKPPSEVVEPSMEEVKSPSSPNKTPKSSGRSKKIESPDLVLTEPLNTSPKKTLETPRKDVENRKQTIESPRMVAEQTEVLNIEQQKQDPDRSIKTPERSMKKLAAPEKATEPATAFEDLESVTKKVSEDFIVAQALAETASAFTDKVYREMHENIALEQEYVQVELTQSMALLQSTNIKDAAVKTETVVLTSAATKDEESNVEEEQEHAQVSFRTIEPASAEPLVDVAVTLASPKSPHTTPVSWESIILSPETKAIPAQEPTPLSLESIAESTKFAVNVSMTLSQSTNIKDVAVETENVVLTSTATKDEESNVEEEQEHAQVSSRPIEPPLVDLPTTPVSWESITLSPETKAIPAQEPTPLSLEAPAESTKFAEPLLITVPSENREERAENENASSPVDSGGSTPGKRNRNRSKKSKSKKKKGKKHQKLQG